MCIRRETRNIFVEVQYLSCILYFRKHICSKCRVQYQRDASGIQLKDPEAAGSNILEYCLFLTYIENTILLHESTFNWYLCTALLFLLLWNSKRIQHKSICLQHAFNIFIRNLFINNAACNMQYKISVVYLYRWSWKGVVPWPTITIITKGPSEQTVVRFIYHEYS